MSERPVKLVLDTNIILAGLLFQGAEFALLEFVEKGEAVIFVTEEILEEIDAVLHYPRLSKHIIKSGLTIDKLLERIISLSHLVTGNKISINVCRDKKDNKFIECAIITKADLIVSRDEDLLVLKKYADIRIVDIKEALNKIRSNTS